MADNERFIVQSAMTDRLYVKTYHDFLDSPLLDGKEKLIFILLKRYLNFRDDVSGVSGEVYPTLNTLMKQANMSKKTVIGILKKLEGKGFIKVEQRGLNLPNIYTLRDYKEIWIAKTEEEVKAVVEMYEDEHEDLKMIKHLRSKGYMITKEKEPDAVEPTKVTTESSTKLNQFDIINNSKNSDKSQELERYTLNEIRELYEYQVMTNDYPYNIEEIDAVMDILYDTLNSTKEKIRVGGENKPTMVVVGKLMRLTRSGVIYAIERYKEQTERIKNPTNYMLTLLYNAQEQMNLDVVNQVQYNMNKWNEE